MANSRVDALAVLEDPTLIANAGAIGQLALKQHLPSIGFKEIAEGGGLIAYGVNFPDMFRQSARLIDKIFKGSKPSDLPVERVTRFEFVANLKTARAIGVTLPRDVADKEVLDAAIVGAAQSVEHYEIARYGTLIAWAESLGHDDIIRLLSTNLNEEKAADSKLSTVAVRKGVNRKAAS
jgi:hypothetical protein